MKRFSLGLLLTAFLLLLFLRPATVTADRLDDLRQLQKELQEKIDFSQRQQNTLKNKIVFYNNQIQLTSLQIEQTTLQIASLSARIDNLEDRLTHLSEVFSKRTFEGYRLALESEPILMLLASDSLSQFVARMEYLRTIRANDRRLMIQLEETRTNYDDQKTVAQLLAKRLESQRLTLDQQRKESAYLLEKYKNDEKTYQQQLTTALAEQAAIEAALSQAINLLKDGTHVDAGAVIAMVGNTGYPACSTGPHLHFEVRKDNAPVDPAGYLKNVGVVWDNKPDGSFGFGGSWDWPVENPRVEQGFGMTYWARLGWYRGNIHTGIDITSDTSAVIRAPVGGTLYKGASACGGTPLKFVAIDPGRDGLILWFWHVQ